MSTPTPRRSCRSRDRAHRPWRGHEISLDYEPWFDDYAEAVDLQPGRMLHWPLNCPHRIDNGNCMNVSFTTEHWTDDLRNAYAVNYANGIIRRQLGDKPLSQSTAGASFLMKAAIAAFLQEVRHAEEARGRLQDRLRGRSAAPGSVRSIASFEFASNRRSD